MRRQNRTAKAGVQDLLKSFSGRLRNLRERRGLSQQELADMVGIHLSQLGRLERGVSTPSAETVLALAHALRATTDALLRGDRAGEQELAIGNVRLFERFRALETLDRDEQETAIKLIDALVAKQKVK
ncbi:MAG: helix-turn-helix transcriptional regulator, partial [Thermoanaerobaculia bacterium]